MEGVTSTRSNFSDVFAKAGRERRMTYEDQSGPEMDFSGDTTWQKIQGAFDDILGGVANADIEMPIALPDTSNTKDVLRYLGELEKAGIDSRASANYMAAQERGGMQFSDALDMMKFMYQQNKDNMTMMASILPNIADEKMQAMITTRLLNMMEPSYFGTEITGLFGGGGKTSIMSEGNVTDTMEFRRIADAYKPQLTALVKAGDQENYDIMMNSIEQMLLQQYKWPQNIVDRAMKQIHADALSAKAAGEDMYGEF